MKHVQTALSDSRGEDAVPGVFPLGRDEAVSGAGLSEAAPALQGMARFTMIAKLFTYGFIFCSRRKMVCS